MDSRVALGLGALTGTVSLIAMVRLVSGAFSAGLSAFAWVFLLLAMVPWVGYVAWRARSARLTRAAGRGLAGLCGAALVAVWLSTPGAVVALAASLVAFTVIWVHDWPAARPAGEARFVRIDELGSDDEAPTSVDVDADADPARAAA